MTAVEEIARIIQSSGGRVVMTGDPASEATGVHLIEDDADIARCTSRSVVVLTAAASAGIRGFRFESLLARAAHRGVAVILVATTAVLAPPRFDSVADSVCVLSAPPTVDLGGLVFDLARVMAHPDAMALLRARQGREVLDRLAPGAGIQELAGALADVVPGLRLGPAAEGRVSVRVPESAQDEEWSVPDAGEPYTSVDSLLLRAMVSAGTAKALNEAPDRALSTLITELLVSRGDSSHELVERSRMLGFDPDGWHVVLAVSFGHSPDAAAGSTLEQLTVEERMRQSALRAAHTPGAVWRSARVGTDLLLICTWHREPRAAGEDRVRATAAAVFSALDGSAGDIRVSCGLSRVHTGQAGLRLAAAEARSSMRTSPGASRSSLTAFDGFGLDRALLDWFSLEGSQELARRLLAPLRALPADKSEMLLHTLQCYLDNQGSLVQTASALYIHRNAVTYRLATIRRVLQSDLADPEERLALQLACRGRHLIAA